MCARDPASVSSLAQPCVCVCVQDARRMLEEVEEELPYDRGVLNFPIKNLKKRWV